jgi:phosphatidylglycerol:prolipoprotein diacylglycerol transferase
MNTGRGGMYLYPIISLGIIKLYTFHVVLLFSVFVCLLIYTMSRKYNISYYGIVTKSMFFTVPFTLVGGKGLFAITQIGSSEESFINNILFGGFVFYGGLIGSLVGLLIYCKIYKVNYLGMMDVFTSLLPLGQAIGRIGCYLNGCCYGREYNGPLAVKYIVNGSFVYVFPTWFAEALFCLFIFVFFIAVSKVHSCGFYTSRYLILYSIFRFVIEYFRGDQIRGIWCGISTSQIISLIMLASGIYIYRLSRRSIINNYMLIERNFYYAE